MRMIRVLFAVASLWSSSFLTAQNHSDPPLLIKAANIIDVDAGTVRRADVLVANGWITEIAVTNRRVIYKRGFISRTTAEMHMDKIESVRVDQSILGRILGYGRVTIMGTGASTESFGKIDEPVAAPLELRNNITAV